MRGLYAIVDVGTLSERKLDPIKFAEAVLRAKPAVLQLRAKQTSAREVLALLRGIAPACHNAGVPLVVNDRADLASFAGCDMVHIGQEDISIDLVRRIAPQLGVGVSTHTPEQLEIAIKTRPTYVAYGPVFHTLSKEDPWPVVGLDGFRKAAATAKLAGIPIVAIGGVDLERARELAGVADMAATIAALVPPPNVTGDVLRLVTERAAALHAVLAKADTPDAREARA